MTSVCLPTKDYRNVTNTSSVIQTSSGWGQSWWGVVCLAGKKDLMWPWRKAGEMRESSHWWGQRDRVLYRMKKTMPKPVMCYYIVITLPKQITLAKKAIAYFWTKNKPKVIIYVCCWKHDLAAVHAGCLSTCGRGFCKILYHSVFWREKVLLGAGGCCWRLLNWPAT